MQAQKRRPTNQVGDVVCNLRMREHRSIGPLLPPGLAAACRRNKIGSLTSASDVVCNLWVREHIESSGLRLRSGGHVPRPGTTSTDTKLPGRGLANCPIALHTLAKRGKRRINLRKLAELKIAKPSETPYLQNGAQLRLAGPGDSETAQILRN